MTKRTWMKKTCALCPFSRSKTLYLHPKRAEDFAFMAQNPYNDFPCHKTADHVEETEWDSGGYVHGDQSFTCAGFLSLLASENGKVPNGFIPDSDGFEDAWEMIDHHTEKWREDHPDYEP